MRIKVKAVSLNYRDLLVINGKLGPISPEGQVLCSDAAGEVVELADDVQEFKLGDRISLSFIPQWFSGEFTSARAPASRGYPLAGVLSEELIVHYSEALKFPAHLSYEEAACLPCAGVTAWHALCGVAPLYPGMTVLTQGGGGVSVFCLQFAKLFGARVIALSSSEERCAQLRELGADEIINYRQHPDWVVKVKELTDGVGVDLAVDLGGAGTVNQSVAALKKGGRLALVGLLDGWPQTIDGLFASRIDVTPVTVGSRHDFELMNRAISFHKLKPVIDRIFPFDDINLALRYLESGKQFGKIVINV
nr:NAD(P)-dependent alcohol dehydrogenase [Zhongshania aquimaris]